MPQSDMTFESFVKHVSAYRFSHIMLHGEGESTIHPQFIEMINYLAAKGYQFQLTTNGTYPYPEKLLSLEKIIVSIDSLDPQVSKSIGRDNIRKPMAFVESCVVLGISTEVVSVVGATPVDDSIAVERWALGLGAQHRRQRLTSKDDYSKNYPSQFTEHKVFWARKVELPAHQSVNCSFVEQPLHRYITVAEKELPCCFIKDDRLFTSINDLQIAMGKGVVPAPCTGCHNLRPGKPITQATA